MTVEVTHAGSRGAIATGHETATRIGQEVLESGGSACDAAVAAAFSLAVLLPEACGLGGDAFALVATPGETIAVNGSGDAPADWINTSWTSGAATATVPGAVAALADMHSRFGCRDWSSLLAPSIDLAVQGMAVSPTLRRALILRSDVLDATAKDWSVRQSMHSSDGHVTQPELAAVLEQIATHGPSIFYEGWISEALVSSARQGGSLLTRKDLAEHTSDIAGPVRMDLGAWAVEVQPPVSQAALIPFALNAIRRSDKPRVPREHLMAEALEEGFAWRPLLSHPSAISSLPWDWTPPGVQARRLHGARGSSHTTSICTADADGTVVTLLISVFHEFGSGYLVPELGFFLNDRMLGFRDTRDERAQRPVHTLSPAVVRTASSCIGLATPGADAQVQVLAQVMDGVFNQGHSWDEALARPRWRLDAGQLVIEEGTPTPLVRQMRELGHDIRLVPDHDHSMGAVTVAGWSRHTSRSPRECFALADSRRGSSASRTRP